MSMCRPRSNEVHTQLTDDFWDCDRLEEEQEEGEEEVALPCIEQKLATVAYEDVISS